MLLGRPAGGAIPHFSVFLSFPFAATADVPTAAAEVAAARGLLQILRVTLHMATHPLHPCLHCRHPHRPLIKPNKTPLSTAGRAGKAAQEIKFHKSWLPAKELHTGFAAG